MIPIENIIRKLRTLDSAAADYVQHLYDIGVISQYSVEDTPNAITWLLTWSEQPQGRQYWADLDQEYRQLPMTRLTKLGNEI